MDDDISLKKVTDRSLSTLLDQFGGGALTKGTAYAHQGRVTSLEITPDPNAEPGWNIDAQVAGGGVEAYEVQIDLGRDEAGHWHFGGLCNCPVAWRCKHMVAVLLAVAEQAPNVIPGGQQPRTMTRALQASFLAPEDLSPSPSAAPGPAPLPPRISPQERAAEAWLSKLSQVRSSLDTAAQGSAPLHELIFFVLGEAIDPRQPGLRHLSLVPAKARRLKATGQPGVLQRLHEQSMRAFEDHAHDAELQALRESLNAMAQMRSAWHLHSWGELHSALALPTLQAALASGRVVSALADGTPSPPWQWGEPRQIGWQWRQVATPRPAKKVPSADLSAPAQPLWQLYAEVRNQDGATAAQALLGQPSWYRDDTHRIIGPLALGAASLAQVQHWLNAPPLPESWLHQQQATLRQQLPKLPKAVATPVARVIHGSPPTPVLRLLGQNPSQGAVRFELLFDYAGQRCAPWPADAPGRQFITAPEGLVELQREIAAEQRSVQPWLALAHAEPSSQPPAVTPQPARFWQLGSAKPDKNRPAPATQLASWLAQDFAPLRELGFQVELAPDWHQHVQRIENIAAELAPQGEQANGWLELSLGFELDGQPINLLPLLPQVLANLSADGQHLSLPERLWLQTEDGQWLNLASAPLQPWLALLIELLDEQPGDFKTEHLRLSPLDALRLGADQAEFGENGHATLRDVLAPRLPGAALPALPEGLQASPRPYQHQGFAWLSALASHHLGGVLADDMGLGKTLQTLIHLLNEKTSGRATQPSLILAPTSLVGNWRRECQRFTPALRLLVLHGSTRHALHAELAQHDLVLTTYPLLQRDIAVLADQPWHALVLDEAQALKNVSTQTAQAARQLQARHRIALTGTPMENHLGELWSLFDLVLPGYLGRLKRFTELFRNPIEKQGDSRRLALLQRRLAPFMLRRDKAMVAAELPPKIEQLVRVSLGAPQAQLYEAIRAAAEVAVQQALASKGLARSHITVLDALLKLRQVCCHPQLLKVPAARKLKESAKLEWLMENLPQMIEEGRRVLLFSQFTSMLALIETELQRGRLRYTLLTGDTVDREAAIARFTSGEVPLFLISLRAGGTGLNLPQADTVIHYDPWWNPAVENQATDRAHRLGQTHTVFVYKLVAEGTLEERILAMQARKATLAQGVQGQGDGQQSNASLSQADLDWLLQPLAQVAQADDNLPPPPPLAEMSPARPFFLPNLDAHEAD